MQRLEILLAIILSLTATNIMAEDKQEEPYQLGPDSQQQTKTPKGIVTEHTWHSKVFPDTVRRYWVYVPNQYNDSAAAAVMVFQDGHA